MRKIIAQTNCIGENFDVVIQEPDFQYASSRTSIFGEGNSPHGASEVLGCGSGFPITSALNDALQGSALVGGLLKVGGMYCGMTVYHFLDNSQELGSASDEKDKSVPLNPMRRLKESGVQAFVQPWEGTGGGGQHVQAPIYSASGSRLSSMKYQGVEDLHCIMDWALVDLPDYAGLTNCYVDQSGEIEAGDPVRTIDSSVTDYGGRSVNILMEGGVLCKGRTSGIPCLMSLPDDSDVGLVFRVSMEGDAIRKFPHRYTLPHFRFPEQ